MSEAPIATSRTTKDDILTKASVNLRSILEESYHEDEQAKRMLRATKAYNDFSKKSF